MRRSVRSSHGRRRVAALAALAVAGWLAGAAGAAAQAQPRAETVSGPDVFEIRGAPGGRAEVRVGPGILFPPVGAVADGTRVRNRGCTDGLFEAWCNVETVLGTRLEGFVPRRFIAETGGRPPGGHGGDGPDWLVVTGIAANDRLTIRARPSAQAQPVGTLSPGETVRNLGCAPHGGGRWCRIRSVTGAEITGWVNARFVREGAPPRPPGGGGGGGDAGAGPDTLVVRGLTPGDRLNVRARPTTQAQVIATLTEGERVANLGCERHGQTRWCRVRTVTGAIGWASARFLREG